MRISLLLAGAMFTLPALAQEPVPDRDLLTRPLPGLNAKELERFMLGRSLFRQSWVIAPASDTTVDGLGPLYNRLACISCHPKNGRGGAPSGPHEKMQSMLVRLSVPGTPPRPHPVYGDQLNEEGIPGVPGEGRAEVHWQEKEVRLADGHLVRLRFPEIRFVELAYGEIGPVLVSPRVGPHVAGLGLLDAVDARTLTAMARAAKPDGVTGKMNRIGRQAGRFGLKANTADLRGQIAGAFHGDMSITSPLFPDENCTPAQSACKQAPNGGKPELSARQLDDITFYVAHLAPPPRRNSEAPAVKRGELLFAGFGCAVCHQPTLQTGNSPHRLLRKRSFSPYTDLLVHDMGPGLADHRPDHAATGSEWRTAPLWGIGALAAINEKVGFLHDGRARTLEEAILWHGGEAEAARRRYGQADAASRRDLIEFLNSL
ncbi:di-heme oxidoredictase family protein [Azonexus hydrophilus]|uniref:di-heme oxidoreductase family protein n=1 Tax=Azonexus hydrophilus TaxID=418702 RepID=UPI0003F98C90|nr:di-heme oxidoredictase family protein [Azonexus hydrophilus]